MQLLQALGIKDINEGASTGPGHWFAGSKGHLLESINPTTGKTIANVKTADQDNYEHIINQAQTAFLQWRQMPAPKRGDIVRQISNVLRENKDALGSLVALEMGKSKQEGDGEVQEMIDIADFAIGQARMLYGKTMHSERPQHRMYEQWHPLGVTAVITAFNFPVAVWAWNAFIAAICGNTVVWKPASSVPLCAIAVQNLCNQVLKNYELDGLFSVFITDDNKLAGQIADDERIPLVSFTGSTNVGRGIAERVAGRLGRSILELGGNNAIIVDETAKLDLAVPAIIFGAVGTAGQRCTTTRRVFIHERIYDELTARLKAICQKVTIGDPLNPKNLMGPLINATAVKQYLDAVQEIKAQGGKILFGGHALHGEGFFVEPCLVEAEHDWDIVQRETFAPILYLMRYQTIEQAIAMQNKVRQGLSSAIFSNCLQHAEAFLSAIGSDCGIANVNIGTSGAEIGGAFGGEKETGGGRESGY